MSIEYTDDIHPRNAYWEMWGLPMFDLKPEDSENVLREVRAAREAFPEHYIKLIAYDPTYTRQTTALSFIVNRPTVETALPARPHPGPGTRQQLPARRRRAGSGGRSARRLRRQRRIRGRLSAAEASMSFEFGMRRTSAGRARRRARGGRRRRGGGRAPRCRERPTWARSSTRRTSSRCSTSSTAS